MNEKETNSEPSDEAVKGNRSEIGPTMDDFEVRLTALVMGEASDFERSQLEALMNERPELRAEYQQLKRLHASLAAMDLREGADATQDADLEWKLSDSRRGALVAVLDGRQPNPLPLRLADQSTSSASARWYHSRSTWWSIGITTAASVLICIGLLLPATNAARKVSMRFESSTASKAEAYYLDEASSRPSELDSDDNGRESATNNWSDDDYAVQAPAAGISAMNDLDAVQEMTIEQSPSIGDRTAGVPVELQKDLAKQLEATVASDALSYGGRTQVGQFGAVDEKAGAKANVSTPADPTYRWYGSNGAENQIANPQTSEYYAAPSTTTPLAVETKPGASVVGDFSVALPQEPAATGYPARTGKLMLGSAVDAPAKPQSTAVEDRFGAIPAEPSPANGPVAASKPTSNTWSFQSGQAGEEQRLAELQQNTVVMPQTPRLQVEDEVQAEMGFQKNGVTDGSVVTGPQGTVYLGDGSGNQQFFDRDSLREKRSRIDSTALVESAKGQTRGYLLKSRSKHSRTLTLEREGWFSDRQSRRQPVHN